MKNLYMYIPFIGILLICLFGWYWNKYQYGTYVLDQNADVYLISDSDTIVKYGNVKPGTLTLKHLEKQLLFEGSVIRLDSLSVGFDYADSAKPTVIFNF